MRTVGRIVQSCKWPVASGTCRSGDAGDGRRLRVRQDPRDVWQLHGDAAIRMELALSDCHGRHRHDPSMRFGHTPVAAARVLLHSGGRCTGCGSGIDLTGEDAREAVHIRTVDPSLRDAPEVLVKEERGACSYLDGPIPLNCWRPQLPADWPGCCVATAIRACKRADTPACSTFVFPSIRNVRAVGRADPTCAVRNAARGYSAVADMRGCRRTHDIWTCTVCTYTW